MKFEIIAIVLIISFGVIFAASGLGSGGFLSSFLGAFGLICIFALIAMIVFAKKAKKRDKDS